MNATMLPERLDITAEDLVTQLRAVATTGHIVLDGQAVQRVDAAGLQLLCAAVSAVKGSVEWIAASPALRDGARTLGLSRALGLSLEGSL